MSGLALESFSLRMLKAVGRRVTEPPQAKMIIERRIETVGMFDTAKVMVDACG